MEPAKRYYYSRAFCAFIVLRRRCADDDDTRRLPVLLDAVLSSDVHGSTTSQVSLLPHEPRPSLLRLLSHLHSHLHSAASLRRTRRHRLANSRCLYIVILMQPLLLAIFRLEGLNFNEVVSSYKAAEYDRGNAVSFHNTMVTE